MVKYAEARHNKLTETIAKYAKVHQNELVETIAELESCTKRRGKNEFIVSENVELTKHFAMMEMKVEEYAVEHRIEKESKVKAKTELEKAIMEREVETQKIIREMQRIIKP